MTGMIVLTSAQAPSQALDPTILLTWLTCLATIGSLVVAVLKYGRRIMQMVEDFNGTQDRPGVPARPGVMQRLQTLDSQVAVIHSEVNYNHGGSIKDAVDRMDTRLGELSTYTRAKDDEKMARLDEIDHTITDMHAKYLERMAGVDADIRNLRGH